MDELTMDELTIPGPHDELAGWLVEALGETLQADPGRSAATCRCGSTVWTLSSVATLIAEVEDELGVWVDPLDVPPGISLDELAAIVLASGQLAAEETSDVA